MTSSAPSPSVPPSRQTEPDGASTWLGRIPLFAMAVGLAGAMLVLVVLWAGPYLRSWGDARFALVALPVLLAAVYLNEYRKLPYEPWHWGTSPVATGPAPASAPPPAMVATEPGAVPAPPAEEPFDDPVEEADRLEGGPADGPSDGPP